jgi:hypothetical protein
VRLPFAAPGSRDRDPDHRLAGLSHAARPRLQGLSRFTSRYLLHPPLPLRWRIALLYTAVLGLTLLAADIAVYLALEHYLESEIDENLKTRPAS